ncbi:MAG: N-acetylneuraminate synthase family protein, partial [Bacteroidia bacterium]
DNLIVKDAPKAEYQTINDESASQYEMLKRLELSYDQFRELQNYAFIKKIKFLSTPDDYESLDFLADELKLEIIKVGSGEVTNLPFLKRIGAKKKIVILSTGMSDLNEVKAAYTTLIEAGAKYVAILHCTSNYPAAFETVNLKAMQLLEKTFNTTVGYSDHTEGTEVSVAAVALGARIIEKHFTLDKKLPGPDHQASLDPEELTLFVKQIRNVEKALSGNGKKEIQSSETEIKKVVTKGIYLNKDISQGEIIKEEDLAFKRPVRGISADQSDKIVNKKTTKALFKGEPVNWKDIES